MADRIVAGRVRSPYGVRGWVWMDSFTDNPASVFEWAPWILTREADKTGNRTEIERIDTAPETWRRLDKGYIVKLVGYPDRTSVESLVNCLIEVDKDTYLNLAMMNFTGATWKAVAWRQSTRMCWVS